MGSIALEGLAEVSKALKDLEKKTRDAAMKGLQKGSMQVIADAQENLRSNRPSSIVTGLLRQSGKVQKIDDETLDVGFFDTQNKESGYAYYVEYGRRAGKMPPPDELAQWAYKKFRLEDKKAAKSIGWALAIKIAREGSTPHPFFNPALEKNKDYIINAIKDAVKQAVIK